MRRIWIAILGAGIIISGVYFGGWVVPQSFVITQSAARLAWRNDLTRDFSEAESLTFQVKVDHQYHDYWLPLPHPVTFQSLKLDPVSIPLDQLWLESVQLFDAQGQLVREFRFIAQEPPWYTDPPWFRAHMRQINGPEGAYYQVVNRHPFFMSQDFPALQASAFKIRLKASLRKSFTAWMLGF